MASGSYDVNDGLREGAVLSPGLYNMFMAGLVRQLKRDAVRKPAKKHKDANTGMQVGEFWMGVQMWAGDLIAATSHTDWETAKEYMKVLMRGTKEWADTHGVRFCDDKSKVLVIGKQFSGACEQTGRPGMSKTKWPTLERRKRAPTKYLGVTTGKRLEWKAHVVDIVSLSKPKHYRAPSGK
jgi:hypothetical protein